MKTILEIRIGDGQAKPRIEKTHGGWAVIGECSGCVAYIRGLWVRTYEPGNEDAPKDGKGFLVGPTRKLKAG